MTALDALTTDVAPGEIRGFVGQNGSGKSTLMKLLTGFHVPDEGEVLVHGASGALDGITAIHQDLCLLNELTVTENLGVGVRYGAGGLRRISWKHEHRLAGQELGALGINCNPHSLVGELSPADRAGVAIARAMRKLRESRSTRVLIVDEATAYFSSRELATVRTALRTVASQGLAVLLVSHNLREVLDVCDSVTILRNGRQVTTMQCAGMTEDDLVTRMLGRSLASFYPTPPRAASESSAPPLLAVAGLTSSRLNDFSLTLRGCEIVGVTGLAGSGFEQIPYCLIGAEKATGSVRVNGQPVHLTPRTAQQAGITLIPADRARLGLWMEGSAAENFVAPRLRELRARWIRRPRAERTVTSAAMDSYQVRPHNPDREIRAFSGGNQQKILLASRLNPRSTRVLLLHEPTQGVDSGAKLEILQVIRRAAEDGIGVIVFSSDHEELVNTCNRLIILSGDGRVATHMSTRNATEDDVVAACIAAGRGDVVA